MTEFLTFAAMPSAWPRCGCPGPRASDGPGHRGPGPFGEQPLSVESQSSPAYPLPRMCIKLVLSILYVRYSLRDDDAVYAKSSISISISVDRALVPTNDSITVINTASETIIGSIPNASEEFVTRAIAATRPTALLSGALMDLVAESASRLASRGKLLRSADTVGFPGPRRCEASICAPDWRLCECAPKECGSVTRS